MKSIITGAGRAALRTARPLAGRADRPAYVAACVAAFVAFALPALAAMVAALMPFAPARAEISIVLRSEVEVSRPTVSLGEVALLTTSDLPTLRRLMSVPLGAAPQPGKVVSVSGASLESWVRSRLGTATPLNWSGPARIEIARVGPAVTRGSFAALAARSGGVEVETRVEVLQDGQPGQRVRVRLPTASASILAQVLAPGRVEAIDP